MLVLPHLMRKFTAMYGTWRFITVFKAPATGLYSKPDESCPLLSYFIKIQFKIAPLHMWRSTIRSLCWRGSPIKTQRISRLSLACHMELLIMQFSLASYYFLPIRSRAPSVSSFCLVREQVSHPYKQSQHFNFLCVNLYVVIVDR